VNYPTLSYSVVIATSIGGAIGAVSRLYINELFHKNLSYSCLPVGTLSVNLVGSFAIGVIFALTLSLNISTTTKALLSVGFVGALTTYSSFAIETVMLFEKSFKCAVLNIVLNLVGTLSLAFIGYKLVTAVMK
jgi:CrcB protein